MATRTLIDTNILVYRYDRRFPDKQRIATEVLRDGIASGSARIAHQSIVEFVAATSRGGKEHRLLDTAAARREAEEFMVQFPILYPDTSVLRMALRGTAAYGLSWFDAHLWACAEVHGVAELLSEDFQHGRMYGTVLVRNPFLSVSPAT
ncbi:MAG: PIN domain-containing protein [bacterium]|nr:PIN domain-containing protein [bacterium]MDE0415965.1 PIN domain-containing protein [bacterium]